MKTGQIVSPNKSEMDKAGLMMKERRYGEFMGYAKDGRSYRIRLFGNKSPYVYHPSFWKATTKPIYCPKEEFHKNPSHKCIYSRELEETDLIQRHNSQLKGANDIRSSKAKNFKRSSYLKRS